MKGIIKEKLIKQLRVKKYEKEYKIKIDTVMFKLYNNCNSFMYIE